MDLLGKKVKVEPKENPVLLKILKDRVAEVFKIYDFYGMDSIQVESVGNVLRMLGCVPLESDIVTFTALCEDSTEKGKIRFDNFFKVFFAWLLDDKMKPADEHKLLDCLKLIDAGNGITENRFKEVLLECDESISDEQLKIMLAIAIDKKTNNVDHDSFACKLYRKTSIYDLAKDVVKPVEPNNTPETGDAPK